MIKPWRATCIQMPSKIARNASNREEAWEIIEQNLISAKLLIEKAMEADPHPALLVLPEFSFQGPPRGESVEQWINKACYTVPGPITEPLQDLARQFGVFIGGNQFEFDPTWKSRYFNTSFIIDGAGEVILRYRRIHTAQWVSPHDFLDQYLEHYGFDGLWPVVDTDLGRMATLACGEIMVPEAARTLMLRGAEILVHPTNEPISEAEEAAKVVAAAANMMYVVSTNVAGPIGFSDGEPLNSEEGGPEPILGGSSRIVDYMGNTLALETSPTTNVDVSSVLDIEALRSARSENSMSNSLLRIRYETFAKIYEGVSAYPANFFLDTPMLHWKDTTEAAERSLRNLKELGVN